LFGASLKPKSPQAVRPEGIVWREEFRVGLTSR